ncbi:uncharacterized protein LOC142831174 [Pelodiscus sinensis]|uniref:uncharacterized protein LOC142831174 n=1 Tax=Pelodiscus sinensis TaxID=13735 RepID=UPI003F6D4F3B
MDRSANKSSKDKLGYFSIQLCSGRPLSSRRPGGSQLQPQPPSLCLRRPAPALSAGSQLQPLQSSRSLAHLPDGQPSSNPSPSAAAFLPAGEPAAPTYRRLELAPTHPPPPSPGAAGGGTPGPPRPPSRCEGQQRARLCQSPRACLRGGSRLSLGGREQARPRRPLAWARWGARASPCLRHLKRGLLRGRRGAARPLARTHRRVRHYTAAAAWPARVRRGDARRLTAPSARPRGAAAAPLPLGESPASLAPGCAGSRWRGAPLTGWLAQAREGEEEQEEAARRGLLPPPGQGSRRAIGEVSLAPRRDPRPAPANPRGRVGGAHLHICHPLADWPPGRGRRRWLTRRTAGKEGSPT